MKLGRMAAAAVTTRLKLGTGIALLLERELFSQAKTGVNTSSPPLHSQSSSR